MEPKIYDDPTLGQNMGTLLLVKKEEIGNKLSFQSIDENMGDKYCLSRAVK